MFVDEDCVDSRSDVDDLRTCDCLYGDCRQVRYSSSQWWSHSSLLSHYPAFASVATLCNKVLLVYECNVGWLSKVLCPIRHFIGHFGDNIFTDQMTKPTVSKHWRSVVSHPDAH